MQNFIENILNILKTNGFPQKRVSLPTEKMYEAADNKGFSFNLVIQELKEKHNIDAQVGADKIVFSLSSDMMKQAQEMMSKMSPEELKRLQDMFMNMSDEEKAEIMKKGKDMGFI